MTERMAWIWRTKETGRFDSAHRPGDVGGQGYHNEPFDNYEDGPVSQLREGFWEVCDDGS